MNYWGGRCSVLTESHPGLEEQFVMPNSCQGTSYISSFLFAIGFVVMLSIITSMILFVGVGVESIL